MKPTLLSVIALFAVVAAPASSQQAEQAFVPGASFLANWDANEDGTVTLEELLERRADVFSAFDSDENGVLDAEEFRLLDEARADASQRPDSHGSGNSAGQGEKLLSKEATDLDDDGQITKEEFLAASEAWMRFMDRNQDAVVSQADFGQGRGKGQGGGQGMGQGRGQGGGQGGGQGKGQNWRGQMQNPQYAMPGQEGPGYNKGQGQGMGRGHQGMMQGQMSQGRGKQGGQGRGQGQPAIAFEAFPTEDGGLWIVDARSGHILYCKAVANSNAAVGFAPVCMEADL